MLYEFPAQLAIIKGLIEHSARIAANTDVDSIDLSVLDVEPAELISMCFNNSGTSRMPTIVAQREAADMVTGHRRLYNEHNMSRSAYYSAVEADSKKLIGLYNYFDAVLQRLVRKGAV